MSALVDLCEKEINILIDDFTKRFDDFEMTRRTIESFSVTYNLDKSNTFVPLPQMELTFTIDHCIGPIEKIDDDNARMESIYGVYFTVNFANKTKCYVGPARVLGETFFEGKRVIFGAPAHEETETTISFEEQKPDIPCCFMRLRDGKIAFYTGKQVAAIQEDRVFLKEKEVKLYSGDFIICRDPEEEKHEWFFRSSDCHNFLYRDQWYSYPVGSTEIIHQASGQKFKSPWNAGTDDIVVNGSHILVYNIDTLQVECYSPAP